MIVIGALILGAAIGALTAKKRGGKPADMLQYAAVYAILFGLVTMLGSIAYGRMV